MSGNNSVFNFMKARFQYVWNIAWKKERDL